MGVADSLGWKLTTFANTAGIKSTVLFEGADNGANGAGEADPFLAAFGIEEVDGVDVEWSAPTDSTCGSTGKILKFVKKAAANTLPAPAPVKLPSGFDSNDSNLSSAETKTKLGYNKKEKAVKPAPSTTKKSKPIANSSSKESSNKSPTISDKSASLSISPSVMEGWGEFCLHTQLLLGLSRLNYVAPTPIQRQVLSVALKTGKCGMNNRDILGCAETVKPYLMPSTCLPHELRFRIFIE